MLSTAASKLKTPVEKVQAYALLAMALHRLGKTDEAKTALAQATDVAAQQMPPLIGPEWQECMTAQLLLQEARNTLSSGTAPNRP